MAAPKTKVVSIRVTELERKAMESLIGEVLREEIQPHIAPLIGKQPQPAWIAKNISHVLRSLVEGELEDLVRNYERQLKNAEKAAKRKATIEAKKASNDTI